MSRNYDNWERLVAAVLRKEENWQLCHQNSISPSTRSESWGGSSTSEGAAVPKFGEWDENDPQSAESFTHIFNKLRGDAESNERFTAGPKLMQTMRERQPLTFIERGTPNLMQNMKKKYNYFFQKKV